MSRQRLATVTLVVALAICVLLAVVALAWPVGGR